MKNYVTSPVDAVVGIDMSRQGLGARPRVELALSQGCVAEPVAWLMEAGLAGSFDTVMRKWVLFDRGLVESMVGGGEPVRTTPLYAHPLNEGGIA